jgi:hypothetical protein
MRREDVCRTGVRRSESGQALVVTGLVMTAIMGATGMAVDMGYLRYTQRRMQTAADAAAVTAAAELNYGDYVTAGQADASTNGFTNDDNNVTVAVNNPPTEGAYAGESGYAEVIITQTVPTFFMKVMGITSEQVTARAVGHYGSSKNCVYALSPSASDAILNNGSGTIHMSCGIVDDSSASQALLNNGSGSITSSGTMVVGGYENNGSGSISPKPTTGVPPQPDPLGYLSEPTVGSCNYNNEVINGSQTATLSQGVYCNGILINGSNTVTFNSGTYIINGGSFTVNGSNTITGNNVTFYLTGGASVTFNGSSGVTLTAPTSGTYEGILFFQDRTDSASATINGANVGNMAGALYFPDAQITYNGSGPDTAYSIVVAKTVLFNGSATVNDDYSSLADGSPIKSATLAE